MHGPNCISALGRPAGVKICNFYDQPVGCSAAEGGEAGIKTPYGVGGRWKSAMQQSRSACVSNLLRIHISQRGELHGATGRGRQTDEGGRKLERQSKKLK